LEKVGISFKKEYLNKKVDNFGPKTTTKKHFWAKIKIFGPEWETESVYRIFTNMPFWNVSRVINQGYLGIPNH
jgi:hypothetical protein